MPRGVIGMDIATVRRLLNLPADYEITYMTGDSDGVQIHVVSPALPGEAPATEYDSPPRPWPLRVRIHRQHVLVPLAPDEIPEHIDRDWRQDVWVEPRP